MAVASEPPEVRPQSAPLGAFGSRLHIMLATTGLFPFRGMHQIAALTSVRSGAMVVVDVGRKDWFE